MLASRVLPPISRPSASLPPTPVATFFNVPRRYVKSNMQVSDNPSTFPMNDAKPTRSLRKSSRITDTRSTPTSSPAEQTKQAELPTHDPNLAHSGRKRLSTLMETTNSFEVDEASPADERAPPSAASTASSDFAGHVCLCQPEPKIPRPRNAFILYRQHHQTAIIARNPSLNNPDISKIIGEQWKAESEEQKKIWQDLAQEEKVRHQEQYPDYRYQPRRVGKAGSSPLNTSGQHTTVDKYRCPKCGGRSIKTPTSPYIDTVTTPTLPPPNISEGLTPTTRYLPMMTNLSLDSPARRRGTIPSSLTNLPPSLAMREDGLIYSPMTPNKKRRFDYGPPPATNSRRPDGPYYTQYASRRDSLPPIQVRYSPPNSATMPPPRTPREGRRGSFHEVGAPPQEGSPRTVEEVLGAFPYLNKIKLLGRIAPPYRPSGHGTPPPERNRGAIIAVEGDDISAVQEISNWLHNYLVKQEEYAPRLAEPPKGPDESQTEVTFDSYLDLINTWHGKSKDMIRQITSVGVSALPSQDTTLSEKGSAAELEVSERKDSASPPDIPPSASSMTPIIILPTFQLQASLTYASRIPIQDAYSATDHWQWMATLWRGIVGPDLTIYVKTYDAKEGLGGGKPDVDDAVRCLTVFKEKESKFTEADLRRVGFEVNEFMQGMKVV
ncbi:slightly ste11-like protein [Coniothyrium glycines]